MSLDISDTLAPNSDQLDATDLAVSGPQTFTIQKVAKNNAEQPINITLAEFPRVWRPGKSMRRVMAAAWGVRTDAWVGQRVTLYCDPDVKFGGAAVGGTRISHMTGIKKDLKVPLLVTRGKSATFTVRPLKDAPKPPPSPAEPTEADVASCDEMKVLRGWWQQSGTERRAQIQARVAELQESAAEEQSDPDDGAPWPAQDALPTEGEQP